jgi:hypothetical protein
VNEGGTRLRSEVFEQVDVDEEANEVPARRA